MEIHTVLDLLTHYPRRYVDRTRQSDIADLKVGDEAVVLATVKRVKSRRTRQGRMIVEVDVFDGTSYLHVRLLQPAVAGQAAGRRAPRPCSSASWSASGTGGR